MLKLSGLLPLVVILAGIVFCPPLGAETSLENRINQLERLLNSQTVLDREQQFVQMQQDIQKLRGEVELLTHQLDQLKKQQQDMYLDIDQRLQKTTSNIPAEESTETQESLPSQEPVPATVAPPPETENTKEVKEDTPVQRPPESAPPASNDESGQLYRNAFDLLQQGQYKQAITVFKETLAKNPSGKFAEDAQYWLAEAYYTLQEFDTALEAFGRFLEKYPKSPKYAHAQLKVGYIYYELKDFVAARSLLEQVKNNYPETATARLAEERLLQLRKEELH